MDLYCLADRKEETKKEREKEGKNGGIQHCKTTVNTAFPFNFSDLCTKLLFSEVFVEYVSAAGSCYTHLTVTDALGSYGSVELSSFCQYSPVVSGKLGSNLKHSLTNS